MDIKAVFQQKLQIDGQCLAIMGQQPNITPGEMGRRDIRVLNAIMLSAKSNQKIKFNGFKYWDNLVVLKSIVQHKIAMFKDQLPLNPLPLKVIKVTTISIVL